jgi:hypothetical protein
MTHNFAIGDSLGNLTLLQDLTPPLKDPDFESVKNSSVLELADGTLRGVGAPAVVWHWNVLTDAQRDVLRALCPSKSANLFISTPIDSGIYYEDFSCVCIWPVQEIRDAGNVVDFTLSFRLLVVV